MIDLPMKKPEVGVVTGLQVSSYAPSYGTGELSRSTATFGTYADYRELREDPTVALGRGLLVAGVLSGNWSVEADEGVSESVVDSIRDLVPFREKVMQDTVGYGRVDFGWMGFEKVFGLRDGKLVLERVKSLLHDITTVLIDPNGNFAGYKQQDMLTGMPVIVPPEKCLHIAFDVEGGDLYGTPLLENIRATQTSWGECDAGAKRYDEKIAGSHWLIRYPPGSSTVDGESVDNGTLAAQLLVALESSGYIAVPTTTAEVLQELVNAEVADLYGWHVEMLSDSSPRQGAFVERLGYLDTLKVRGMGLPERSVLEGHFGTKAEAGAHGEWAILLMEELDQKITREFNEQVVDQLLILNYGPEAVGTVRMVSAPLVDKQIGFLRELYTELSDPNLDVGSLRETLGLGTDESSEPLNDEEGDNAIQE